jgi:putative oxidoreductase
VVSNFGLLVLRLVAGGYIIKFGLPKFRDADGSFAKEFESFGFHPASTFVKRAGMAEVTAGALIVLGALGPVGPMLLLSDMVVAGVTTTEHAKHFDFNDHEEQAFFAAIALLLALGGPGAISADAALNVRAFDRPWLRNLSVLGAFAGAAFMLSQRGQTP